MWQVKVSHKSEMAGPFNRGDTIINKHFTFIAITFRRLLKNKQLSKRFLYFRPKLTAKTGKRRGHNAGLNFRTHRKRTKIALQ